MDLIYAEIQRGRRTTIKSELKTWHGEGAKADTASRELSLQVEAFRERTAWL